MDRRTLLALALSAVIIIVWSTVFSPKRPEPEQRPAPDATEETVVGEPTAPGAGETMPADSREVVERTGGVGAPGVVAKDRAEEPAADDAQQLGQPQGPSPTWDAAPDREVEIATDLGRYFIATLGGGLIQADLFEYPSGEDPEVPVNLIRTGHQVLDLSIVWRDPSTREISHIERMTHVPFTVVADSPTGEGGRRVVLKARRQDGLEVTREYVFVDGAYRFKHGVEVTAAPSAPGPDHMVLGWRAGLPHTEAKNGKMFMMRQTFQAMAHVGGELHEWNSDSFEKKGRQHHEGNVHWAVVRNKYFLAALVPAAGTATGVHADGDKSSSRNEIWMDVPLSSTTGWSSHFDIYVGPSDFNRLKAFDNNLEKAVRLGWSPLRPLGRLMLAVIQWTYKVVPNYGIVIILVSIAIRLVLHPLNRTSMKSMKAMQDVQPEMKELRKKYADNPQELNKRMMALYKDHGVNPLGGCLPMVVQMPFLFALYYVLMFSVDLRMAPFVLWIDDLSAPDTIGTIMGFQIHVLPLVMTGVSVLQARSTPKDPRQAAMTTMMPVIFLFLFYNMPSGLVLYWTIMNAMAWGQQAMMNRGDAKKKTAVAAEAAPKVADVTDLAEVDVEAAATTAGDDGDADATPEQADDAGDEVATDGKTPLPIGGGGGGRQRKPKKRKRR